MQVWMKACRKKATCAWCGEDVKNCTYMVVGQYYIGKWRKRKNWHPDCWIAQGIDALERRDYVENRGRQKLALADDKKIMRFKILARRASVLQRMRKAQEEGKIEQMTRLGLQLEKLMVEIEPYGGVPNSW